ESSANKLPKYRFYIQGGLHGNEKETSKFVAWLATRVMSGHSTLNKLPSDQVAFDFVPIANPDDVHRNNRYNQNPTNLNRNFGHLWGLSRENPGTKEFSEPETKAIKYMLDSNNYLAAVDVHGYINWLVAPSAPDATSSSIKTAKYHLWKSALE